MSDQTLDGTAATMARVGLAGEALVWWLGGDPRVQLAYVAWRVKHGLLPGAVMDAATLQGIRRDKEQDLEALARLVRHELGLDYPWLAPLLLFDFGVTVVGEGGVRLTPEDVGLPDGRRAKGKGQYIARDVEWYYRAEIKQPPDPISRLAREHVKTVGNRRGSDGRATVQDAIRRTKKLLAVLALESDPLPK